MWLALALFTASCSTGVRVSTVADLESDPGLTATETGGAAAISDGDDPQTPVPPAADPRPRASARAAMTGPRSAAGLRVTVDPACASPGASLEALVRSVPYADLAWGVEFPDGSNHGEFGIAKAEGGGEARWTINLGEQAPEGSADLFVAASRTAEREGESLYQETAGTSFRVDRSC